MGEICRLVIVRPDKQQDLHRIVRESLETLQPADIFTIGIVPMTEFIDISPYLVAWHPDRCPWNSHCNWAGPECPQCGFPSRKINFVMIGGDTGPNAAWFDLEWARTIRDQCKRARVPFHIAKLGSNAGVKTRLVATKDPVYRRYTTIDPDGADVREWPSDLQNCRQSPF